MTTTSRYAALARRQHRVISVGQLQDCGLNREAIRHQERTERIWRRFRGVYALEGPLPRLGDTMAAVLACGERVAAGDLSAAGVLELTDRLPSRPQVVMARRSGAHGPEGVTVRHSRTLRRSDVTQYHRVPVTAVGRTLIDCARLLGPDELKPLLRRAESVHRFDLGTLDRPGIPVNLRDVLDDYVRGSSFDANELEAAFYEIAVRAGLLPPRKQAGLDRFRVDFLWPELRLIVETDGRQWHDRRVAFTEDRRRDRALAAAGFVVIRFTWAEVQYGPAEVGRQLRAVYERRARDRELPGLGGYDPHNPVTRSA